MILTVKRQNIAFYQQQPKIGSFKVCNFVFKNKHLLAATIVRQIFILFPAEDVDTDQVNLCVTVLAYIMVSFDVNLRNMEINK